MYAVSYTIFFIYYEVNTIAIKSLDDYRSLQNILLMCQLGALQIIFFLMKISLFIYASGKILIQILSVI